MRQLPITVVIVTWNSAEVLPACLKGVAEAESKPAELIVVDNASTDGTVDVVKVWALDQPDLATSIIANPTNRGFAVGANQGIDAGTQPLVCLVNPDLRLQPDTLDVLAASLTTAPADVAVVGGKLLRALGEDLAPTSVIDSTGIVMTRDGRHFDRGAGTTDDGRFVAEEDVFGITGALALFRLEALEASRVDGEVFDEDFFAYREDADLAWRLQGFGYRARYVPRAVAYHRRNVTPERRRTLTPAVNRHSVKNRFLLRIHHADLGWLLHFGLRSLWRDLIVVGACLTVERPSLPALRWLLRHWRRHHRRRAEILARRRVSSRHLRDWFR